MNPMESETRLLVDKSLENLGYNATDTGRFRHVYMGQPRTEGERRKLNGRRPDYVVYSEQSDAPLMVIETKKSGECVDDALAQGASYAKILGAPIVFATDGVFCKSLHSKFDKPLILNQQEVDEFIRESLALKFLNNYEVDTLSNEVRLGRQELIRIFGEANDMLRSEGLRAGIDRFGEFANILFLKLISEAEEKNEAESGKRLPNDCRWDFIKTLPPDVRIDYINGTIHGKLNRLYRTEIFTPLQMSNPFTLREIMGKLDPLQLNDVDSDIKGDAFEYFLRESTASGNDLGEYFTPRHIVKTMVRLVNPQIGEKVYDPFCGTGGILIESFRHIWNTMPRNPLTINQLRESTIYGNEITNTARITKMNMILAGDGHCNINMADSLANPVNNKYDIVITNMPYSQKTNFGNLYPIPSKNGDSICVQHCLQAINGLSENGRMALVVPEGFLFRKDLAKTRELLLEKCNLRSIISLPKGVFLPYTSVKTNIIYCDRVKNHNREKFAYPHYWYFPVKNDGYTLNGHRRKLDGPSDLDRYAKYRRLDERQADEMQKVGFELVPFNTLGEEHKLIQVRRTNLKCGNSKFETITIGELAAKGIITIETGKPITKEKAIEGDVPVIASGKVSPYFHNEATHGGNVITISSCGGGAGFVSYHKAAIWASNCNVLFSNDEKNFCTKFLYYALKNQQEYIHELRHGTGLPHIGIEDVMTLNVPILSPEEQKKLVIELDEMDNAIRCAETLIDAIKIIMPKRFSFRFRADGMQEEINALSRHCDGH
ncbi:MAG: N-6 DNA methylase [Puniceicoccales bacterium]|jgi:type I restriction enzyme M protein|nr:N-6 DNA methylase [Puniceicoccales bacterium]